MPLLLLAVACDGSVERYATLYEVAGGYKGWVLIRYGDPTCPRLLISGTYRVVSIPSSGRSCTAESVQEGWRAIPNFEYVYPDGSRSKLSLGRPGRGGEIWMRGVNSLGEESFFVGTEDEFRQEEDADPGLRTDTPS